jgi:hypothetical protein
MLYKKINPNRNVGFFIILIFISYENNNHRRTIQQIQQK